MIKLKSSSKVRKCHVGHCLIKVTVTVLCILTFPMVKLNFGTSEEADNISMYVHLIIASKVFIILNTGSESQL